MKILKGLIVTVFILFIGAVVAYFCVPAAKDWTNKQFGWGEYKQTFTVVQTTRDKVDSERFILPTTDNVLLTGIGNLVKIGNKEEETVVVPQSTVATVLDSITYKNRINKIELIVKKDKKETTIVVEDFNVVFDKNAITSNGFDAVFAISFAAELEGVDSIQIVYTLNEFDEKTTTQRSNVLHLTDVTTDTAIVMEG